VKSHIVSEVEKECEPLVGEAMTYTIFEWIREHEAELTEQQPDVDPTTVSEITEDVNDLNIAQVSL